ncbi:MAG: protein kinase [Pirellulales bacterium]|nr:protein kinase [Pirellulales bacterium]
MIRCSACQRSFSIPPGGEIPYRCPSCGVSVLGPYCELVWIGGGGMGDVYRAREPEMGNRTVALKIPRSEIAPERAQRRFEREIAATSQLQHENMVRAYHRGQEGGRPYLVMEFVSGCKLSDVIRREHPLSPLRAAKILLGIARGLAHAENRGVINRDIKPENIILAMPEEIPKILDYGLALMTDFDDQVTRSGAVLGTPSYTAPEQFRDPHSVTIAGDVYSWGCTAYCCLTGRPPFRESDLEEKYRQHAQSPRPRVRDERPDVPEAFDRLIQRAMASDHRNRPSPRQLIDGLTELLPTLSDQRPWIPAAAPGETVDVICPGCGTSYHLAADTLGKRIRCPNKLCQKIFSIDVSEAPSAEAVEAEAEGPGRPEMVETRLPDAEPIEAEFVDSPDAGALDREPGLPVLPAIVEGEPIVEPDVVVLPADAIIPEGPTVASETLQSGAAEETISAPSVDQPLPSPAPKKERTRRQRRMLTVKLLAVGLISFSIVGGAIFWFLLPSDPTGDPGWRWNEIKARYDERKWSACLRNLDRFERDFPDHPKVVQAAFFRDMCRLGDDIYSFTGNAERGLARLEKIFKDRRDNPAYQEYCIDLYMALAYLIEERFLRAEGEPPSPQRVALARKALGLLKTVNEAIKEPWVAEKTAKLSSRLEEADHAVRLFAARQQAMKLLALAQSTDPAVNADGIYDDLERLTARNPALREERDLVPLLSKAYRAEAARIRFSREEPLRQQEESTFKPEDNHRQGDTVAVVWGKSPAAETAAEPERIVLALARGILYAFDARGSLRWARRLGVDANRLPERISPSKEFRAVLIAVDADDNSLLALDPASGSVLWRYAAGGNFVAPLTVVPRQMTPNSPVRPCGLLPTSEGEIHVVELALGKRLGRFHVGQPMTVGGAYDPVSRLAFFPADSKRIYAIDPAAIDSPDDPRHPPCPSILFTNHASGSLRSKPSVVGQYLIISEATELEHTKLRAFEIRGSYFAEPVADAGRNRCFPRPVTKDLKEQSLRGWAWFAPHSTPDRITLVTDEGDLGLFGLNLDNADEAIYPMIQTAGNPGNEPLVRPGPFCSLVIAAEEHLLWVMAGGRLQKFSLDVFRQEIKPAWSEREMQAGLAGIPIHEAQRDRQGKTFYLATMSPGGRIYHFTAVSSETGEPCWRRQLGLSVLGDPILFQDSVVLLDRTGRAITLQPGVKFTASSLPRVLQLAGDEGLPQGAEGSRLMRVGEPPDPIHLLAPLDHGTKLAVRRIDLPPRGDNPWTIVPLPEPLQGRPGLCRDCLVVPCADGQLYRCPLDAGAPAVAGGMSFTWARFKPPGVDTAEAYPLGEESILLVDGRRRVRRLDRCMDEGITCWKVVGEEFHLPAPMCGRPLLWNGEFFLCDSAGTLFRLDARNPGRQRGQWPLEGKVTGGPVVRKGGLLLVVENRKLVRIELDSPRPRWISPSFAGRVVGLPLLAENALLVADNSRCITGISLSDGGPLWKVPLGVSSGPSAAPVPYGPGKMLVSLMDGTLLLLPVPREPGSPAETRK